MTPFIIPYALFMAAANRARGSKLFGETASTTTGRLVSTGFMACATSAVAGAAMLLPVSWACFMLWCVFAWDNYWSAAIGHPTDITKSTFAPVDWIMRQFPAMPLRLWGTIAMGLRGMMLYPLFAYLAFTGHPAAALIGLLCVTQGIPYLLGGHAAKNNPILFAEILWGLAVGLMLSLSLTS